jgi:hypothetical protein
MAASPTSKPFVPTLLASLIAILIFWVATRLMTAWIPAGSNEEAEKAALREKTLAELRVADEETLQTYGWVNKEKGIVRVPIERAMELVLVDLNARKPAPAYPVQAAPAAPAPAENVELAPEGTAPPVTPETAPAAEPANEPPADVPAEPAPAAQ